MKDGHSFYNIGIAVLQGPEEGELHRLAVRGSHAAGTAAVVVELLQLINGGHQLPLLRIVQLVGQQVFPVEGAPGGFPADHRADTGHGLVQSISHRQVPLHRPPPR